MLEKDLNSFRVSSYKQISVLHYFLYTLYLKFQPDSEPYINNVVIPVPTKPQVTTPRNKVSQMYRNTLRLEYAKSDLLYLGGIITNSVDSLPTQTKDLCYNLLPVQFTELTH